MDDNIATVQIIGDLNFNRLYLHSVAQVDKIRGVPTNTPGLVAFVGQVDFHKLVYQFQVFDELDRVVLVLNCRHRPYEVFPGEKLRLNIPFIIKDNHG